MLVTACNEHANEQAKTSLNQTMRTDVSPIMNRLPNLGKIQAVWWTATKVTADSFLSPPGNSSYRLKGLAQLEKLKSEELSKKFDWQQMPINWKPGLAVTNLDLDSAEWSQSSGFTKDCKPQQIVGELFFERQKGIVYFDIEIEK